ncbi:hypothetical protein FB451DRAFT_1365027 [Mycena latifolia]|nr:hypothetical protein FB451DRAFT_1365027 [Mycena latifolia]
MNYAGRRTRAVNFRRNHDGGLVGRWPHPPLILRVSTFDPACLRPTDFIDIPRSANLFLDVFGHKPTTYRQFPWAKISFRPADSPYTRPDTRLRGFLHYHVPIPSRPLSGGLRFRCATSPWSFANGHDLLCPSGLAWVVPFANLVGIGSRPIMQSLLRDNLVSLVDIIASRTSFTKRLHPDVPVVHAVGQPWYLNLRTPTCICVPGPHGLLRCWVYPAVALYGSALVCFEHTGNPDHPDEVAIRILELRSKIALHPTYAHLPPLLPGSFLAHPFRVPPRMWTWNHDMAQKAEMAAGLHCLINGPGINPKPSNRLRQNLLHYMHYEVPTGDDIEWYTEAASP